jgi:hypothetical protein
MALNVTHVNHAWTASAFMTTLPIPASNATPVRQAVPMLKGGQIPPDSIALDMSHSDYVAVRCNLTFVWKVD